MEFQAGQFDSIVTSLLKFSKSFPVPHSHITRFAYILMRKLIRQVMFNMMVVGEKLWA